MFFKPYIATILLSTLLLASILSNAQDGTVVKPGPYGAGIPVNYVRTWDASKPTTDAGTITTTSSVKDFKQATQYFDGLGRPLQTIAKQGSLITDPANPTLSVNAKDLVIPVVYDEFGREVRKYLPYAAPDAAGTFKSDPFEQQRAFYAGATSPIAGQQETYYYGKTEYEPSPLNRVDRTYAPGNSWVKSGAINGLPDRGVKLKYYTNTITDDVRMWSVTNGAALGDWGSYAMTGPYGAGQLYKTITIDEQNKQVIEFKDKEGKVVLKKVQLSGNDDLGTGQGYTGWMCTYYIYDDLGQLRCVVPPVATQALASGSWNLMGTTYLLDRQCFCYEYDNRGRMIMKKVAGVWRTDAVYMVYDARDRLVMTQDGKQRKSGVNIWVVTLYENTLNRPVLRGFYRNDLNNKTFKQNLADAAVSDAYPWTLTTQPTSSLWAVLMQWGYDNYTTLPTASGLTKYIDLTYTSGTYLYTTYNASPEYAQNPAQSFQTNGMVTWTKILIYNSTSYYYTVNIYDDKGRVIQVKSTNHTGGKDVITTQYNWTGQPLRLVQKQAFSTTQTSVTLTDISYDDLGRPVQTQKKLQNSLVNGNALPAAWTVTSKNEYDALGQLKKRELGKKKDATGNYTANALAKLNYQYNIRGWLLTINKDYTNGANNDQYFALELGYDKDPSMGTYTGKQHNGNINSMLWKSEGDGQRRKYNFSYDAANRLTGAAFGQYASGSGSSAVFNTSAGVDFTENGITYDGNGNIKTLNRNGLKLNTSPVIDQLTYTYSLYDNKPHKISDAVAPDATSRLGDYQNGANADNEYTYSNGNGSLTKDQNKGITSIEYWRTSELPKIITTAKGTITYTHDDLGNKLKKVTVETASTANGSKQITTTTNYIGTAVYESRTTNPTDGGDYTNKLQFIAHEEGRIRALYTNATNPHLLTGFAYDYFIKDHLGNVRLVLTEDAGKKDIYPAATLEGDMATNSFPNAIYKEKDYYTINTANVVDKTDATGITDYPNNNAMSNPNPYSDQNAGTVSNKLYKLQASSTGGVTGLGMTLKVMSGDKIDILGKSYYFQANGSGSNYSIPASGIIEGLFGAPASPAGAKGATAAAVAGISTITGAINTFLSDPNRNYSGTQTPKAYINYILFDEQFNVAGKGFSKVGTMGAVYDHYADPNLQNIVVTKNGFLYVYVSNESPVSVFFDNVQVVHTRGAILEESHFYAFGMRMENICSRAASSTPNRYQYKGKELQSKEFSDDSGLEWLDFGARMYDNQIGRWHAVDPLSEKYNDISPYAFVKNNPINNIEIDGRYFDEQSKKQAARMERRAEKQANKLEKKANKLEAKGKDVGDLRERVTELRQSGQDVRDMRESSIQFRIRDANDKSNTVRDKQGNGLPVTALTGVGQVTMYISGTNNYHEPRHGGQIARGEYGFDREGNPSPAYGVHEEISAYRAQYSWSGKLEYREQPAADVMLQRLKANQDPTKAIITNINQINANAVNSMVDPGFIPIYPPRDAQGNLIIPLDVWNRN